MADLPIGGDLFCNSKLVKVLQFYDIIKLDLWFSIIMYVIKYKIQIYSYKVQKPILY